MDTLPKAKEKIEYEEIKGKKLYRQIMKLKEEAKTAKNKFLPPNKVSLYIKAYNGQQYPSIDFSPYSKWKTRQVVNYTGDVVDFITSFLIEQQPHPYAIPPSEDQQNITDLIQSVIDEIWKNNFMDSITMENFIKTALIVGSSYLKIWFDPTINDGNGDIIFDLIDPRDIYIDPTCGGNLRRASYIIWEKEMPYEEVVRRFPNAVSDIEESMATGKSLEKDEQDLGPHVNYYNTAGTQTWDFNMITPQKDYSSGDVYEGSFVPSNRINKVAVLEAWLRDYTQIEETVNGKKVRKDKFTKNIRVVTIVGQKVIQDASTPYVNLNMFPYVMFLDKPVPFETTGLGTVSQIWPLQMDINQKTSYITDYMHMAGNPIWIVDKESGVKRGDISNLPGLIVNKEQNTEVRREPPPDIPNGFFQQISISIEQLKELSGATDVLTGKRQKGTRSAEQQTDLKDSAQGKLRLKLIALKKAVSEMGEILLNLIQQYFTSVRMIRIGGDYEDPVYVKFTSTMVDGPWKIRVESMPSTPSTRQSRFQQATQLYQMGVLDKESLLSMLDWPNRGKILERANKAQDAYLKALEQRLVAKSKKPPRV